MNRLWVPALALAALAGCGRTDVVMPGDLAGGGMQPVVFATAASSARYDPYEFVSMDVHGDTLEVDVRFGGGCARHDFALVASHAFMESYPVQVAAALAHDAHGDPCRAIVARRLHFDLTPLKHAYQASYGIASDTIHMNVSGWPAPVVYRF